MSNDIKKKETQKDSVGPRSKKFEKAKDFKGTVKKLYKYMRNYRFALLLVFLLTIISSVIMVFGPRIMGDATNELVAGFQAKVSGTGGINFDKIFDILAKLLSLYVLGAICNYIQAFIMATIAQKLSYNLRKDLEEKINRLPLSYFDTTSHGDIISRATNDVNKIGENLSQSLANALSALVVAVGFLIMMFSISWVLTIVALVVLPISGILIGLITSKSQKYFNEQQSSLGKVTGHAEEMYGGHIVVKAFNGEEDSMKVFDEHNENLFISAWKSQFLSGLMMPIVQFVGNIGYVLVCLVGGTLAVNNSINIFGIVFTGVQLGIGDIQAFIQYVNQFNQQLAQAAQIVNLLQTTVAAGERVFELLDAPEMEPDTATPRSIVDKGGINIIPSSVTFDNVKFGYNPEQIIINDFSLRVGEGQKVAIVGPTGAGKTTIVKLLMRFYELTGGDIYVGDHNIKDFTRADLRSMFGMVLQDAWLFSGTVLENLRYSKPNASDKEVHEAAQAARVDHFVKTLEHGYDTELNEDTSNVSQGQKQLLTIARAFLADPKILILDEATSSVDTRTEVLIQEGMDNLMKGRTSFVIAHRLSTIRNADVIIVMDKGDIVEIGDHEELLEKDGFYAKLYNSQFDEGEEE